jgi:hypothetical protein
MNEGSLSRKVGSVNEFDEKGLPQRREDKETDPFCTQISQIDADPSKEEDKTIRGSATDHRATRPICSQQIFLIVLQQAFGAGHFSLVFHFS